MKFRPKPVLSKEDSAFYKGGFGEVQHEPNVYHIAGYANDKLEQFVLLGDLSFVGEAQRAVRKRVHSELYDWVDVKKPRYKKQRPYVPKQFNKRKRSTFKNQVAYAKVLAEKHKGELDLEDRLAGNNEKYGYKNKLKNWIGEQFKKYNAPEAPDIEDKLFFTQPYKPPPKAKKSRRLVLK